jgi:hypothetical protein
MLLTSQRDVTRVSYINQHAAFGTIFEGNPWSRDVGMAFWWFQSFFRLLSHHPYPFPFPNSCFDPPAPTTHQHGQELNYNQKVHKIESNRAVGAYLRKMCRSASFETTPSASPRCKGAGIGACSERRRDRRVVSGRENRYEEREEGKWSGEDVQKSEFCARLEGSVSSGHDEQDHGRYLQ